jgi:hypothetical protein
MPPFVHLRLLPAPVTDVQVRRFTGKKKGKFVPVPAMKAGRSRGIAPLILNLGTRWRCVVNVTPLVPFTPIEQEAAGAPVWSKRFGEDKCFLPIPGSEPRNVLTIGQSRYLGFFYGVILGYN